MGNEYLNIDLLTASDEGLQSPSILGGRLLAFGRTEMDKRQYRTHGLDRFAILPQLCLDSL